MTAPFTPASVPPPPPPPLPTTTLPCAPLPSSPSQCNNNYYSCVECLTPSSTLYRHYNSSGLSRPCSSSLSSTTSSSSSIKLTQCKSCQNNVDPYIERDLFLVGMDYILLRTEAYRHLLFNRFPFASSSSSSSCFVVLRRHSNQGRHWMRMNGSVVVWCVCMASVIDAWLILWNVSQAQQTIVNEAEAKGGGLSHLTTTEELKRQEMDMRSSLAWPAVFFFLLVFVCCFKHMVFILGTTLTCLCIINDADVSQRCHVVSGLYMAIMIPRAFHIITAIICVWDTTPTVRVLSSIFVLVFQCKGVGVVMERALMTLKFTNGVIRKDLNNDNDNDDNGKNDGEQKEENQVETCVLDNSQLSFLLSLPESSSPSLLLPNNNSNDRGGDSKTTTTTTWLQSACQIAPGIIPLLGGVTCQIIIMTLVWKWIVVSSSSMQLETYTCSGFDMSILPLLRGWITNMDRICLT